MEIGNRVKFIGCSEEQMTWGSNDNPFGKVHIGEIYTVSDIEVHSWYTKISFNDIKGKFNSVCFEIIEE